MNERFAADFLNRLPLMSFILGLPQIRFTLIHTYRRTIRCYIAYHKPLYPTQLYSFLCTRNRTRNKYINTKTDTRQWSSRKIGIHWMLGNSAWLDFHKRKISIKSCKIKNEILILWGKWRENEKLLRTEEHNYMWILFNFILSLWLCDC